MSNKIIELEEAIAKLNRELDDLDRRTKIHIARSLLFKYELDHKLNPKKYKQQYKQLFQ